jgi:hypothetical protein
LIAILPLASTILERHVKNHLMNFLNKYHLFYSLPSGFRLHHSCQTVLTFMIDRWLKAVDKGELIGSVFLYLAKAILYRETCLNRTVLSTKCLCSLNMCKLNTCLSWTMQLNQYSFVFQIVINISVSDRRIGNIE